MSHARTGLAAALLLAGAAKALAEPAVVGSKLNLRAGPGAAFSVIAMMPAGSKLDVQKCNGNWCQVRFGRQTGYASRAQLNVGSNSYASASAQPSAAPAAPSTASSGAMIWRWRDAEWRDDNWRRLEWHNRLNTR